MGRRRLVLLLLLAALCGGRAAPVAAESPCRQLTRAGGDGVVGTGLEGGEGDGGTGIFGTITGFASVCVNGLEIHIDAETRVELDGNAIGAGELAAGQVVWIQAVRRSGGLHARRVAVVRAALGPVSAVDAAERRIVVAGRVVEVPAEAIVFGSRGDASGFREFAIGEPVGVYGLLRADGRVVASRIDRVAQVASEVFRAPRLADLLGAAEAIDQLSVEGFVGGIYGDARFRLGELEVDATAVASRLPSLDAGAAVWIQGRVTSRGSLAADRIEVPPVRHGPEPNTAPPALSPPDAPVTEDSASVSPDTREEPGDTGDLPGSTPSIEPNQEPPVGPLPYR
jgi:hypothetical protein